MTREEFVTYHDNYARVMEKYILQRGVRGSEARHTCEFEANVQQLQTEQQQAEQ